MSKKDEALKLALETSEGIVNADWRKWDELASPSEFERWAKSRANFMATILREALAEQPARQEPVIWMYVNKSTHETKFQKHMRDFVDHGLWSEVPLYGEPLANHELQCVCGAVWLGDEMVHLPDKRPPAQRTWVGLTDEEVKSLCLSVGAEPIEVRFIEAKLKEKNT